MRFGIEIGWFGVVSASFGLWWNLRCSTTNLRRSATRCRICQSLSFHQSSSPAIGVCVYPQRRSRVGDLFQCMQTSASHGISSCPSGGRIIRFAVSPLLGMAGYIVTSLLVHRPSGRFSHSASYTMQLCPNARTSKASPSPSLVSCIYCIPAMPLASLIAGISPASSYSSMSTRVNDHEASGRRRIVRANDARDTTRAPIAIQSIAIIFAFLGCLPVCLAIPSLRPRSAFREGGRR